LSCVIHPSARAALPGRNGGRSMSNRKRRLAALTVGATLLGLVLSTTAASAQPATSNSGPTSYQITLDGLPASTQELLAEVAGSNLRATLTLITGDQVVVGLNHDGVPVVQDIVAAPRADGATPVFYTVTRHRSEERRVGKGRRARRAT